MAHRLPCVTRLLLLDGHSLAYRAFFALPVENFSTTTGQTTNAVYGFTSMLINVLRDEAPTHVAVAFDVAHDVPHRAEYADYKAGRASTRRSSPAGPLVREVLDALRIATWRWTATRPTTSSPPWRRRRVPTGWRC
jgi:DNA polymerase I